jgi:5'-nucleotidase
MTRTILRLALQLLLLVAAASTLAAPEKEITVTLLHVNDVYQISPVDKGANGGLARVATLANAIRKEVPRTLVTLGGDTLSPSVASNTFRGAQMVAVWNALKLDVAVLGNHEFDFGPEVLRERIGESRFPWLGANVSVAGGKRFDGVKSSVLRDLQGIKIGIVGVITADTATSSRPGAGVRFADPIIAARREAARLRAQGAQAVVALTHVDLATDQRLAATGAADVILGGHEHALLQSLAGRTPVFKVGSDARLVGRIDLVFDARTKRLKHIDWAMLPVTSAVADDSAVAEVVAGYERKLAALLDEPVGETTVALDARQETNRSRETNLGSWIADVYRARTGAEAAIVNGGSIRSNTTYGPGKLSKRDILSILPFENPIVKLEVPGRVVRQAIEHGLSEVHVSNESGKFPQVSGIRYRYDAQRPVGSRVLEITVNGKPLDDAQRYAVAVSGYLSSGGDGYAMLKGLPYLTAPENALSESAEVIETLAAQRVISPAADGRIERVDSPSSLR